MEFIQSPRGSTGQDSGSRASTRQDADSQVSSRHDSSSRGSIKQDTSSRGSIKQDTSSHGSIKQDTSSRGSIKQDTSSRTSSGRSSKGPSHSTPVKSFNGHNMDKQKSEMLLSPSKPRHSSTLSSVKKNLSISLGPELDKKPSSARGKLARGNLSASEAYRSGNKSQTDQSQTQWSTSQQAKMADFENQTIQKQRQELALMVAELRDRDRELNDMVAGHQKQLAAWEQDRQKILSLSDKCVKLEREIDNKNDEMRSLVAKLRVIQCEDKDKSTALNNTQEQLVMMSEQQSQTSLQLHDLEQRNHSLSTSVHDMSCAVGQLEAREQELLTVLQLKDRDLSEASTHIAEVGAKLKKMELQFQDAKAGESDYKRKVTDWKNKCADQQREVDYTKKLLNRSEQRCDEQHVEIQRLRQEVSTLKKEVTLSMEREKRKDQLLDLQRSKQDRTDAELSSIRQLYERQQKDLSLLHVNLENTKDLLYKNNISVPGMGSIGLPRSSTGSRSPYQGNTSHSSYHKYSPHKTFRSGEYTQAYDSSHKTSGSGEATQAYDSPHKASGSGEYTQAYDSPHKTSRPDEYTQAYDSYITQLEYDDLNPRGQHHTADDNRSTSTRVSDLDLDTPGTPSSDHQKANSSITAYHTKDSDVKETDSPAIKLHKLLTESRDMVEELERSVGDKDNSPRNTEQPAKQPQDNKEELCREEKEDVSKLVVTNGEAD